MLFGDKRMGGFEALFEIFEDSDLRFVERILLRCYGPEDSVGRPHRNLLGMFKTELAKRLRGIKRYRELDRLLQTDETLRSLCNIKEWEKPYSRPTLMRFRQRVGPERLERIMRRLVKQLEHKAVFTGGVLALDATFIKAYSRRDPRDSSRGLSDIDARLRKQGRNVILGYGVHLAVETGSEMPLAAVVEPANVNEKKVAPSLLHEVASKKKSWKSLVADSQYSSEAFRDEARRMNVEPVIPYPKNQMKGKKVLRVDRRFRSHGPARLKRLYRRRSAVERVISRLKGHFGLRQPRTRGLRNVLIHTLFCIIAMLLTALSSIKHGLPKKIRSPVSWWNIHV